MSRLSIALALLLLALPATAAHAQRPKQGPAGSAFYTPPKSLPGSGHGGLVWTRRQTGPAALKSASRSELLLYRSVGVRGRAVAVSGTLALPKGRVPKGGWPVISYAHGTTGTADACAPSRVGRGAPLSGYVDYAYPLLNRWLKAGYAIVRTDYEGLGTPGVHPYLVGRSEGRSVLDAVRAARRHDSRIGRSVVIAGHSQGGHAALWGASLAPSWTPELRVRGTVAFAPASHLEAQARAIPALTSPGGGLSGLIALIFRGADTARPGLGLSGLLSDRAKALYPQTLTTCLPQLGRAGSFGGLAPADIPRAGADPSPLFAALGRNDPEKLTIRTPVLIAQGRSDTTVFPALTDALNQAYVKRGVKVTYKNYEGVNHAAIVNAGAADATSFLRRRFGR